MNTCAIFGCDRGEGNYGKDAECEEFGNHGLVIIVIIIYRIWNVEDEWKN